MRSTREQKLIAKMFDAYVELQKLGWKEPQFAPKDGETEVLAIEAGSTGIHFAKRDEEGEWWLWDGSDSYSSSPMLWRPK